MSWVPRADRTPTATTGPLAVIAAAPADAAGIHALGPAGRADLFAALEHAGDVLMETPAAAPAVWRALRAAVAHRRSCRRDDDDPNGGVVWPTIGHAALQGVTQALMHDGTRPGDGAIEVALAILVPGPRPDTGLATMAEAIDMAVTRSAGMPAADRLRLHHAVVAATWTADRRQRQTNMDVERMRAVVNAVAMDPDNPAVVAGIAARYPDGTHPLGRDADDLLLAGLVERGTPTAIDAAMSMLAVPSGPLRSAACRILHGGRAMRGPTWPAIADAAIGAAVDGGTPDGSPDGLPMLLAAAALQAGATGDRTRLGRIARAAADPSTPLDPVMRAHVAAACLGSQRGVLTTDHPIHPAPASDWGTPLPWPSTTAGPAPSGRGHAHIPGSGSHAALMALRLLDRQQDDHVGHSNDVRDAAPAHALAIGLLLDRDGVETMVADLCAALPGSSLRLCAALSVGSSRAADILGA